MTTTENETLVLPDASALVADRRSIYAGELDRLRTELAPAVTQLAARDRTIQELRTKQITDGADIPASRSSGTVQAGLPTQRTSATSTTASPRPMNGPARERVYDVDLDVTVTVRVSRSVYANDSDSAGDIAREEVTLEEIIEAARDNGYESMDSDIYDINRT